MKNTFSILPTTTESTLSERSCDDGIEVVEETKCTSPLYSDEATVTSDCEVEWSATRRSHTKAGLRTMMAFTVSVLIGLFIVIATLLITKYPFHKVNINNEMEEMLDACPQTYAAPPPFAGKKGAALGMKYDSMIRSLQPYWNYNWQNIRSVNQPDDIEWVPMIWGGYTMESVRQRIETHVMPYVAAGKVKRIFGYNEPDSAVQSNVPIERALNIWPALESANVSLVSPSCAQPGGEWMQNFMYNSALNCQRIDWVGVHWYGMANFTRFTNTMKQYYEMYGRRPLVITEFAVADYSATTREENKNSRPDVLAFMKKALPWLQKQSWIAGYAWFAFHIMDPIGYSSALFDTEGKLTVLGRYYQSVRNESPRGNQSITHYTWKPAL